MSSVAVTGKGAVLLGHLVACDGFYRDCPVRVQTHVHSDHMGDFNSSKGTQTIFVSRATRDLLIAEKNADLPIRSNLIGLQYGTWHGVKGSASAKVRLLSSGHMLGAAQVEVEYDDGTRVGYSGDFAWPLLEVARVDKLVVDCTYGSPEQVRRYSQAEAEECLLDLVLRLCRQGPVYVKSHRGTLERALAVFHGNLDVEVFANSKILKEISVYQKYGHACGAVSDCTSENGLAAEREGRRFVRLLGPGDPQRVDMARGGTQVTLSAFMSGPDHPMTEYSERSYCVAMSNHADFDGTMAYVDATGARQVLVDNSRHGNAVALAEMIRSALGVQCAASDAGADLGWGR